MPNTSFLLLLVIPSTFQLLRSIFNSISAPADWNQFRFPSSSDKFCALTSWTRHWAPQHSTPAVRRSHTNRHASHLRRDPQPL